MKRLLFLLTCLLLPAAVHAQGGSPDQTTRSPRGDFRIEQYRQETGDGDATYRVQIVPTAGPKTSLRGIKGGFPTDFAISPNEQFIFGAQKYVSSVGLAYLYRRSSGLTYRYRPATPLRFDEAAWRHFHRQRPQDSVPSIDDGGRIVDFVSWSRDSRHLHIQLRGRIPAYWLVDYDTQTGQFRLLSHSPNSFVK